MMEYKKPEDIFPVKCTKLTDWKFIEIKDTEMFLYYDFLDYKNKEVGGFNFYCIEAVMWGGSKFKRIDGCKCIFKGIAYWDGIRHLYFGDKQTDNYDYLYYPHIDDLNLALKELKKLEKKYCRKD